LVYSYGPLFLSNYLFTTQTVLVLLAQVV